MKSQETGDNTKPTKSYITRAYTIATSRAHIPFSSSDARRNENSSNDILYACLHTLYDF